MNDVATAPGSQTPTALGEAAVAPEAAAGGGSSFQSPAAPQGQAGEGSNGPQCPAEASNSEVQVGRGSSSSSMEMVAAGRSMQASQMDELKLLLQSAVGAPGGAQGREGGGEGSGNTTITAPAGMW